MVVRTIILHSFASNAMESIDVKLPLERLVLCLFEVTRHNVHREFTRFVHSESLAVRLPRHNVLVVGPHYVIEHFVKLEWKGQLRGGRQHLLVRRSASSKPSFHFFSSFDLVFLTFTLYRLWCLSSCGVDIVTLIAWELFISDVAESISLLLLQ